MLGILPIIILTIFGALLSVGSPLNHRHEDDQLIYAGEAIVSETLNSTRTRKLGRIKSATIYFHTAPPPLPNPSAPTPTPLRVAVGFHGDFLRTVESRLGKNPRHGGCSDAFVHWNKQLRDIINPLNASSRIYVSTIKSSCEEADLLLSKIVRPRAIRSELSRSNIATGYVELLEMMLKDKAEIDAFVLVRFDLKYRYNISGLGVDWSALNYAFRDPGWKDGYCHMTSDLFFAGPIELAHVLFDAAVWSAEMTKARIVDPHSGKKCSVNGGMHFTYDRIKEEHNETKLHFLDSGFHSSMPETDPTAHRQVVFIDRTCGAWAKNCSRQQSTI